MRKKARVRPELESLESMTLLSGVSAASHQVISSQVEGTPKAGTTVELSGTVKGTYKAGKVFGAPITFKAKGSVSPLGSVSEKGSLLITLPGASASMTVTTKHGKIDVTMSERVFGGPVKLTIDGGTGQYLGASGSGSGFVTFVPKSGKGPVHGTFDSTFQATLVPCTSC